MKHFFTVAIALTLSTLTATAQTEGFSYQAVVRNAAGNLVDNSQVGLRLTLTTGQNGETVYQETHTPTTNSFGVLSVTVGAGTPTNGQSLSNVNWASGDVWMNVEIDPKGGNEYTNLGATKLQSVPYAYYAITGSKGEKGDPGRDGMQVNGSKGQTLVHDGTTWVATDQLSIKKLDVKGEEVNEDALFEVKDKDGNVVFAVYPNGVYVYIDPEAESSKARRSGFYITGREDSKDGENTNFFSVDGNGTQVFVDDNNNGDKARRSGFYITGREDSKDGENTNFFSVDGNGTQVFVDDNNNGDKARRSGFYITGREDSKDGENANFFSVDGNGTQVFVDDNNNGDKARRSGFYITGREDAKDGQPNNYLTVNDEGTKVFIDNQLDDNNSKVRRSGFLITGRESQKDGEATNYMKVATDGTLVHFDNDASKVRRSGFLITGRDESKGTNEEYMTINTDSTRFYINSSNGAKGNFGVAGHSDGAKDSGNGGFAVSGRNGAKDGASSNLFNIDLSTNAQTLNGENRIYWYPEKNAFMAGNLVVEHPDSVGTNSFSAGYQNKSIGEYSQALGYQSVAKGDYTTAIGREARAISDNSYAFGNKAHATGQNAVAIGNMAKASAMNAYALGMNSAAYGEGSYAFGDNATARGFGSFAMGRSSVIKDTTYKSNNSIDKIITNTYEPPVASGNYSYSIGSGTKASAEGSFAMGINNMATAKYAVAFGRNNISQAVGSIAFGKDNTASGSSGVALGIGNRVTLENGVAIGFGNSVTSSNSTAIGFTNTASGGWLTALGRLATTNAYYSVAIGFNATANSPSEVVVGTWNDEEGATTGHVDSDSPNSRAFVIGSGWESWGGGQTIHRRNAVVVLRNGDMDVTGNLTYKSASQSSDIRLKKDIQQLDSALDKVLKLRGVSYYWKNAEELAAINGKELFGFDDKKHIGVIAQEVEAVVPELVVTGKDGFKSVTYENIAPLLIEAIKEQQAEIEELRSVKAENEAIKKEMAEMKKMMEELMKK